MKNLLAGSVFGLSLLIAAHARAQQRHVNAFALSESFINNTWRHSVAEIETVIGCSGPQHPPANDCEIHIGASLTDTSISDYPDIVIEPPNVCKFKPPPGGWRKFFDQTDGKTCRAKGMIRVWPEHLDSGSGCSNPPHFMELHPALSLRCEGNFSAEMTKHLKAFADLGYKPPELVLATLDTFRLWLCKGCEQRAAEDDAALTQGMVSFDYYVCDAQDRCGRKGVSNFARLLVTVQPSTIRPTPDKNYGFLTAIAHVVPIDQSGSYEHNQMRNLKLYAVEGTDFYQTLDKARGRSSMKPVDVIGIYTVDALSVKKALDKSKAGEWTEVEYPVSMIIFGQTP